MSTIPESRGRARMLRLLALGATLGAVVLAGCSGVDDDPSETSTTGAETGDGTTAAASGDGADLEGQTVEIIHEFSGEDGRVFLETINAWADERGVDIIAESTSGQPQLADIRVEAGNPPDIISAPNPSRLQLFYDSGDLQPIDDIVDMDALEESMIPGVLEIGKVADGTQVGFPHRLSVKSLVWHAVPEFDDSGYEPPETWDDMLALTDQIRDSGAAPWCLGIEAGGATGWVMTDWIEEILLRTAGPEFYDQWVRHEVPFDSPEVVRAGELFAELAFTEGNVRGGRQGMVSTSFGDSPGGMFQDPPACFLHRQANFITGFFPDDVQDDLASSVGFFPFPDIEADHSGAVLGSGNYLAMFADDNPAAEELLRYMSTPEYGERWAAAGGYLSPHSSFDPDNYGDETTRQVGEILADAEVFRFDASDMMTTEIGAGAFWTEMTAWVNGDVDLETALGNVEERWNSLE